MNPIEHCRHCENMWGGPIFYEGSPSPICWMAEALGEQEVKQERPLIGPAGKVFNQLLSLAGISREEQFLMNVVSCRPPNNQVSDVHIRACLGIREALLAYCKPKVIVALGSIAMKTLLGTKTPGVTTMRGRVVDCTFSSCGKVSVVVTLHPSFIMRKNAEAKSEDRVAAMYQRSVVSDFVLAKEISQRL